MEGVVNWGERRHGWLDHMLRRIRWRDSRYIGVVDYSALCASVFADETQCDVT